MTLQEKLELTLGTAVWICALFGIIYFIRGCVGGALWQ